MQGRGAIADFVRAERVRSQVIQVFEKQVRDGVNNEENNLDAEAMFWLRTTLLEAYVGVG